MLKALVRDHETIIARVRKALATGDEATFDLMTQRLAAREKHAWMPRASPGGI